MIKRVFLFLLFSVLTVGLLGCSSQSSEKVENNIQGLTEASFIRTDDGQGGVQVEVLWQAPEYYKLRAEKKPAYLDKTIAFEITMTTHAGDLTQYPILEKAILNIEGKEIKAADWKPEGSVHHLTGILTFPDVDEAGKALLKDDSKLELNVKDLYDVPQRIFVWQLPLQ